MRPDGPPPVKLSGLLVALAVGLLVLHAGLLLDFLVDDAFISLRYSRNIAAGLGPVFNAGERVEGFSNPLYTFLMSLPAHLPPAADRLPLLGRLVGLASAAASLVLLARLPLLAGGPGAALALLLSATSTSLALWSVGGLETTLYGFLILAAMSATLARPGGTARRLGTGLLLAAVTLSRPEGIVTAGLLYAVRFLDPRTRHERQGHLLVGLAFALPVLGYLGLRLSYYGDPLPNTFYAKKLGMAEAWRRGSWYLVSFVHHNGGKWLWIAAPLALLDRPRRRLVLVAGLLLAGYLPYVLYVGGDWMDQHRFLAPVVPLLSLMAGLGWGVLVDRAAGLLRRWPGGAAMRLFPPLSVLLLWGLLLRPTWDLTREQRERHYVNAEPYYGTIGRLIGATADSGWAVATHDIGAIGWYGGTRVVDLLGLVDRDLARGRASGEELIRTRRPELVVLHYDNRPGAAGRWRSPDLPGFDSLWVAPRSDLPLPGSFRVRADRAPEVESRLRRLSPALRSELAHLDEWLQAREPDGRPRRTGN